MWSFYLDDPYYRNFLIGLVVILVTSWDRLNRPLVLDSGELSTRERLIRILAASQFRKRKAFLGGCLVYFTLLSLLYFFTCYIGEPVASLLFDIKLKENQSLIPLYVSLTLIGVGSISSRFPAVESRIRRIAYIAAGIPENFNNLADDILQTELHYADYSGTLSDDEKELHNRIDVLSNFPGFDETQRKELIQSLARILIFDNWRSSGPGWPGSNLRREYEPVARLIAPDVSARIEEFKSVANMPSEDLAQLQLASLLARARITADDISCLFALFIERASPPKVKNSVYQLVSKLIALTKRKKEYRAHVLDALAGSFVVGALIIALWGYLGSSARLYVVPGTTSEYVATFRYLIALMTLVVPPPIVALLAMKKNWRPSFSDDGLFPFVQYILLFFVAFIVYILMQYLLTFTTWYYAASFRLEIGATINQACRESINWNCFVSDFSKKTLWMQPLYFAGIGGCFAVALALIHDSVNLQKRWGYVFAGASGIVCGLISFVGNEIARQLDPNSKAVMSVKWFGFGERIEVSTVWSSAFQGIGVFLFSLGVFVFYSRASKKF